MIILFFILKTRTQIISKKKSKRIKKNLNNKG